MLKLNKNKITLVSLTLLSALTSLTLFLNMIQNQKVAKEGAFTRNYLQRELTFVRSFPSEEEGDIRYFNDLL